MNEFEFLAVFISIVVGLGVTHILYGLARLIHNRGQQQVAVLHFVWTLNVVLILLLNWWVLFLWADYPAWSFDVYLLLIAWAIALYMLAVILYPPDIKNEDTFEDIFEQNCSSREYTFHPSCTTPRWPRSVFRSPISGTRISWLGTSS